MSAGRSGPLLAFTGVSVVTAIGYTIKTEGIFIPIDISVRIPTTKTAATVSITTGFNFTFSKM